MSACIFIASDMPLVEVAPSQNYPFHIELDNGTIDDGGADDNYFLTHFEGVGDYTDKKYGVNLEWNYTDGRAQQIIEYIKAALQEVDVIEFWHVWLMDYYEYEDRPFIHRYEISIDELASKLKVSKADIVLAMDSKYYPTSLNEVIYEKDIKRII